MMERRRCVAAAMLATLAGCATAPEVLVRQQHALPAGARTLALDGGTAAVAPAVRAAGYTIVPTSAPARFRLTIAAALAPAAVGGFAAPEGGAAAPPPAAWALRPRRTLAARLHGGAVPRVTAILIDGATGVELWRGAAARPGATAADIAKLEGIVLARLPRA